jgi:hypothetical protein
MYICGELYKNKEAENAALAEYGTDSIVLNRVENALRILVASIVITVQITS